MSLGSASRAFAVFGEVLRENTGEKAINTDVPATGGPAELEEAALNPSGLNRSAESMVGGRALRASEISPENTSAELSQ